MAETQPLTLTLTDFLLARIAEDEARVDSIPDWYCTDSARGEGWGSRGDCPICGSYMFDGTESVTKDAFWDHLEDTHRRTRVLAECEAKRRIVEEHPPTRPEISSAYNPGDMICASCVTQVGNGLRFQRQEMHWPHPCPTLRALALPYADHPDYCEEWRP